MLTIMLCIALGLVAIKVICEIVRISGVLLLLIGGIILIPIIIIGVLAGLGVIILIVLALVGLASIL